MATKIPFLFKENSFETQSPSRSPLLIGIFYTSYAAAQPSAFMSVTLYNELAFPHDFTYLSLLVTLPVSRKELLLLVHGVCLVVILPGSTRPHLFYNGWKRLAMQRKGWSRAMVWYFLLLIMHEQILLCQVSFNRHCHVGIDAKACQDSVCLAASCKAIHRLSSSGITSQMILSHCLDYSMS